MICGLPVPVRLLLPQLQPSRWKHLMPEPRSQLLQLLKTFCQKSDKNCGPPKPKAEKEPSGCTSYKKDPCDESSVAPKMEKDCPPKPSNTRLDRRRKYLAEMEKKKAKKEPPEEPNHCAKPKEEKASKKDSCGQAKPKASKESACGKTEPKASTKDPCSKPEAKAAKESACGKTEPKASKEDSCGPGEGGQIFKEGPLGKSVAKQSPAPTCETAADKVATLQPQQTESQIAKRAPSANEIRQPVDWNAMESLLSCMVTGVKVACVTHEERKIFDKLAAARDRRLDHEEEAQNMKCAAGAAKNMPPDADPRAKKCPETVEKGEDSRDHEE
ncbi:GL17002 [Drosophila persimilis]|uniref:GL17002 n=1 Tax=Drosophila persimilis TaxID=7234 RepID=B4GH65_DROPE|nr:GL17002 [Drosophila persimilis]